MSTETSTELASFHDFVSQQLQSGRGSLSPEEALALWRERVETIEVLQEGLEAVEEGRTKPLDQFVKHFVSARRESPARHGFSEPPHSPIAGLP